MKYPIFFKYSIAALLVFVLTQQVAWSKANRLRCMWRTDPATSMVIGWDQVNGSNPVLYYDTIDHGDNPEAYTFHQHPDKSKEFKGMHNHFVRLENLIPNTVYYFIISDSQCQSKRYSFKTMPDHDDAKLSIIAGGDSRNNREIRQSANLIVSKMRPHFVLFGGDMTGKDSDDEWVDWMNDWQKTIAEDGRITPIVVARGNHEYSNQSLLELFDVAHPDLYYRMEFANNLLHVYTLNSLMATGGDQKAWLEKKLARGKVATWKMGQYHFTIRPHTKKKAERNDQYENWAKLFYKYGMDLVVESDAHVVKSTYPIRPSTETGHEEGFIRDDENGTVYVGEGCWGAPLRTNDDDKSWTRNSGSFNQFKWILVDRSSIEIRTIKTDNGHKVGNAVGDHAFTAPPNLDVWNPSNGAVIYIQKETQSVLTHSPIKSSPNHNSNASASSEQMESPTTSDTQTSSPSPKEAVVVPKGKMKISDFKVILNDGKINVAWTTENEPGGMQFEIQRSLDGRKFVTVETVDGTTKPSLNNSYFTEDTIEQAILQNGLSYRIRRTLANGDVKVFAPHMVGGDLQDWNMFAQISSKAGGNAPIKYNIKVKTDVSVRLLNLKNRIVQNNIYKNQMPGNYEKTIDMSALPKGQYIVIIKAGQRIIRRYKLQHGM